MRRLEPTCSNRTYEKQKQNLHLIELARPANAKFQRVGSTLDHFLAYKWLSPSV